jgi:hypothetical protein
MLGIFRIPLVTLMACAFSMVVMGEGTYNPTEEKLPSGRLEFISTSFGLILGYSAGDGRLYFDDQEYPFSIKGIKVGMAGISKVQAIGSVYNLNDIADFEGRYGALDAGMTLVQGGNVAILENKKGVRISLQTYQHGAEVSLGASGFDILFHKAALEQSQATGDQPRQTPMAGQQQRTPSQPPVQAAKKTDQQVKIPPLQLISQ